MKTTQKAPVLEKKWEIKDRTYVLKNGMSPLTYKIKSRGILWFDEDKGINREIKIHAIISNWFLFPNFIFYIYVFSC